MRRPAQLAVLPLAALIAVVVATALPSRAAADDVYLTNGQVFEGVVARRDGDKVRIRMGHGEMRLPVAWIDHIVEADSVLAAYLERKAALEPGGGAREWLDLALWARDHGFPEGAREAGLRAAAIDPGLDGLAPILRAAGYTFDGGSGAWLTEPELMARRGYVRDGDEWVPAAVVAERARVAREAQAEAARQAREARLDRTIELLALSQIEARAAEAARERAAVPYAVPAQVGAYVGYAPVTVVARPVVVPYRPSSHPPSHPPERHHGGFGYDALAGRQPGSIIPIALDPGAARTSSGHGDGH